MKHIYTVITPDGLEVVLGIYSSEARAQAAFKRMFPADWRALSSGPLVQRAPDYVELRLKRGALWRG